MLSCLGRAHEMESHMLRRAFAPITLTAAAALSGCLHSFVPAPLGTPLDEVCNPVNGALAMPVDTFVVGIGQVAVPRGWSKQAVSSQELQLRRIDAELNIWSGRRFVFQAQQPRNQIRCTLARGDTSVTLTATRVDAFNYRVDAEWEPSIEGQFFYMQLHTRQVVQLREMRGIVEAVRFVPDTSRRTGR